MRFSSSVVIAALLASTSSAATLRGRFHLKQNNPQMAGQVDMAPMQDAMAMPSNQAQMPIAAPVQAAQAPQDDARESPFSNALAQQAAQPAQVPMQAAPVQAAQAPVQADPAQAAPVLAAQAPTQSGQDQIQAAQATIQAAQAQIQAAQAQMAAAAQPAQAPVQAAQAPVQAAQAPVMAAAPVAAPMQAAQAPAQAQAAPQAQAQTQAKADARARAIARRDELRKTKLAAQPSPSADGDGCENTCCGCDNLKLQQQFISMFRDMFSEAEFKMRGESVKEAIKDSVDGSVKSTEDGSVVVDGKTITKKSTDKVEKIVADDSKKDSIKKVEIREIVDDDEGCDDGCGCCCCNCGCGRKGSSDDDE